MKYNRLSCAMCVLAGLMILAGRSGAWAQVKPVRVALDAKMVTNEAKWGEPALIVDEQSVVGDPPAVEAKTAWPTDYRYAKDFPISMHLDLGKERHLAALWIYDINGAGDLEISTGSPGKWTRLTTYRTEAYKRWVTVPLDASSRYLRLTRVDPGAQITEIALYEYTEKDWAALLAQKEADKHEAEQKRIALAKAQDEVKNRPVVDLGEPFGKATLVDEIDCAAEKPDHLFAEFPAGVSKVESILGQRFRVAAMQADQASYLTWRIGKFKLLKPGAAYVLEVDYPEDAPRSMVVMNGGCESSRGFHTGATSGDAVRAKYVWGNPESLKIPLSGKIETWTQLFNLHDRFPKLAYIRGAGARELTPDDGFPVTIAQYSAENDPPSKGIAVRRIRLLEVIDTKALDARVPSLPAGLPRRHIFWREEMADGVIDSAKPQERGLAKTIDWYRYKSNLMHFLGINTFAKDLLEFGACQHWDSTPGGGHNWVFFAERHKELWGQVVEMMGKEGFDVLPYYEYAGSRGYKGIGHQRRCKPLGRDDAYTHIKWIEQSNADVTDPDTHADFKKMLDLTVLKFKDKANFVGAWIRPRMQLPMSFSEGALGRFSAAQKQEQQVTREMLLADKALRARYYQWWLLQRKAFVEAMRDHLIAGGLSKDAAVMYTADSSEPGVSFPSWEKRVVTDDPAAVNAWLAPGNAGKDRPVTAITTDEVVKTNLYLKALTTAPLDWGKWEVSHASPAADPQNYRDAKGAMMTHGFNRAYTTLAQTLEPFTTGSGLAIVRHYSLNENMMYDKAGKDILGYFVADMERAGPYCMMAEALAVANGDPYWIGYLSGGNYTRGFPGYAREFNRNFLALPALPSKRLEGVSADAQVVVRAVETPKDGTWLAIVNTGWTSKAVTVTLPPGQWMDAVSGQAIAATNGALTLNLYPCQLKTLHRK